MKLSKNFDLEEFICPCCGKTDVSPNLIIKLQELRDRVGEPIYITSGVRCAGHNKKVGGYSNSPHLKGLAADIQVRSITMLELLDFACNVENIRIGIYPNHLHIDIVPPRPSKYWLVRKYGKKPIYSGKENDLTKFLKEEK